MCSSPFSEINLINVSNLIIFFNTRDFVLNFVYIPSNAYINLCQFLMTASHILFIFNFLMWS